MFNRINHPVPEFNTSEYIQWRWRLTVEKFLYFVDPNDAGVMASLRNICAKRSVYQVCRLNDHEVIDQLVRLIKDSELAVVIHPEIYGKLIEFWLVPHVRAYDHIGFLLRCGNYPHEVPRELEIVQPMGYPPREEEEDEDRPRPPSTAQTPSQLFGRPQAEPVVAKPQRSKQSQTSKQLQTSTKKNLAIQEYINAAQTGSPFCAECEAVKNQHKVN